MATTPKAVKTASELLADRVETAATWVTGPRALELQSIAKDLRKVGSGDAAKVVEASEPAPAEEPAKK